MREGNKFTFISKANIYVTFPVIMALLPAMSITAICSQQSLIQVDNQFYVIDYIAFISLRISKSLEAYEILPNIIVHIINI
jgi:hypothetical protein